MTIYPIGINLSDKPVLMVGAGTVATRKLTRLVSTGCKLTVVSCEFTEAFSSDQISCLTQPYEAALLDKIQPILVFACTDNPDVNAQIATDCHARNIWVNSATEGLAQSDFIVPGLIHYEPLQIALFSGGASPLFIKHLRETLEAQLGPWVGPYLTLLQQLRQEIQAHITDESERHRLYQTVLEDAWLLQTIQQGELPLEEIKTKALASIRQLVV